MELRSLDATIDDVLPGERAVVARIGTDSVDRFQTVVDPAGISFRNYEESGRVVLWEHGFDPVRGKVPIGKNLWLKYRSHNGDLLAKTKFHTDDFSQNIFDLYKDGTLRGFSVAIRDDKRATAPPTQAELKRRPDWAAAKLVFRRSDMVEYSAVAVPGNPQALAVAVSRGLWVPEEIRTVLPLPSTSDHAPELPRLTGGRTLAEVHRSMVNQIRSAFNAAPSEAIQASLDLYTKGQV